MERPGFMMTYSAPEPHPLAPDAPVQGSATFAPSDIPPEEEKELRQVSLFVELLEVPTTQKEHSKRLGFKAESWQKLHQFWFKQIRDAEYWRPGGKRRPRRIEDTLLEGMLMIETQKRLYGNVPWFAKEQELSHAEVVTWMTTLDADDVHFTLYMYFDGGWKERLRLLDDSKARLKTRSERAMKRPLSATPSLGEPPKPIDRGSAIAEQIIKGFEKSKGYGCSDVPTLVAFWKHKSLKNKIWALYTEPDIRFTLESYYAAREEAVKKQRQDNILSVMQQKPKPKPAAKKLPKNFAKHVFGDYKDKKLVFDLIKMHFAEKKAYSNDPTVLFEFWTQKDAHFSTLKSSLTEQDQVSIQRWRETMSMGEGGMSVKRLIDNFFSRQQLLARILAIYQYSFGFPADSAVKALALWKRLESSQKYECGVHYEPETQLKDFLVTHFRKEPAPAPPPKQKREPSREIINKLAKSKSRWTLEENIAALAKRFPYDPTIKHMLVRERSLTPHVRYASEYDVFHPDEEALRKMRLRVSTSGSPTRFDRKRREEQMRVQADKIRILETQANQEEVKVQQEVARMNEQIKTLAKDYLEKREHGRPSVTLFLGAAYSQLKAAFPVAVKRRFPFANYGAVKPKQGSKSTCKC